MGNAAGGGDLLYRWGNPQVYDAGEVVWSHFSDRGASFRAERYAPDHPGIVALGL